MHIKYIPSSCFFTCNSQFIAFDFNDPLLFVNFKDVVSYPVNDSLLTYFL